MCSANIGEDRLSTSVLVHFGLPPQILLNPWALCPCIWCCSWKHICAAFSFPFKFRFFWAPLARAVPRRRGSSLVVFGNGRTHTGEVDGSGGSRLANYCLRAPTKRGARGEAAHRWAAGELFSGTFGSMSEWLMAPRGGVNLFPPFAPQPQNSSDSMIRRFRGTNFPQNQCVIQQKIDLSFEIWTTTRSIPTNNSILYKSHKACQ